MNYTINDTLEFLNLSEEEKANEYLLASVRYITDLRNNKPIPYALLEGIQYFIDVLCGRHSIPIIFSKKDIEKELNRRQLQLVGFDVEINKLQRARNGLHNYIEELIELNKTSR